MLCPTIIDFSWPTASIALMTQSAIPSMDGINSPSECPWPGKSTAKIFKSRLAKCLPANVQTV